MKIVGTELKDKQGNKRGQYPFVEMDENMGYNGESHHFFFFASHTMYSMHVDEEPNNAKFSLDD